VTYTALDEATKGSRVSLSSMPRAFYAGAANASTKLAGEILASWRAQPGRSQERPGAAIDVIENVAPLCSANDDDSIPYYAHCISRTGSYLSAALVLPRAKPWPI
jgi:ethanolamine utilization protein EutL